MRNREGWKVKTLGEVCEVNYGTRVVKNKVSGTKYYVYGGGGATFTMDEYNREDSLVVSRFAMSQQCVRFVQGKFFLNDSGLTLSVKEPESLAQHFLNHHMFALNDEIYNLSKGVAQRNLDVRSFRKLEIKIPPLPTQHQIVAELDTLNSIIDKKKEQLNELDNLAQATFYDMFGDPVENEKGWEVKYIEQLITKDRHALKRGPFGGSLKKEIFVESGYLVYEQYHALNNDFSFGRYYIDKDKFEELKAFEVKSGDVIISCSGVNLGRLAIVPDDAQKGVINQALLKISLDEKLINSTFFVFVFSDENFKRKFYGHSIGSGIPNFPSMKQFKEFRFISPSIDIQNEFAEKIKHIEQQKALIQRSIDDVQQLFDYTMDKYFN